MNVRRVVGVALKVPGEALGPLTADVIGRGGCIHSEGAVACLVVSEDGWSATTKTKPMGTRVRDGTTCKRLATEDLPPTPPQLQLLRDCGAPRCHWLATSLRHHECARLRACPTFLPHTECVTTLPYTRTMSRAPVAQSLCVHSLSLSHLRSPNQPPHSPHSFCSSPEHPHSFLLPTTHATH